MSEECNKEANADADFVPRCCLCGSNHESKNKLCPKRMEFIEMRMRRAQTHQPNNPPLRQFPSNFNLNASANNIGRNAPSYPPLRPVKDNQLFASWFRHSPSPKTTTSTPAHEQYYNQLPLPSANHNQSSNQQAEYRKDTLFSPEELLGITKSLILALRQCKTQMDQFEAVASVALKFGMHNTP